MPPPMPWSSLWANFIFNHIFIYSQLSLHVLRVGATWEEEAAPSLTSMEALDFSGVLCQPRQLPLSSQNKSNKWSNSNTIEMECAFVLFCVKRASIYLAMQTIFSLNCSIFTQTRIIRQSCLYHGVELQINCWQSSHKSPAQLQVPERRNPANQIPDSR